MSQRKSRGVSGASNPKFFCENCGAQVDRNSERCPECGRYFSSVRCPSCGFTGAESLFRQGCPVCGYCVPADGNSGSGGKPGGAPSRPASAPPGKLPLWVYIVVTAALIVVGTVLFFSLR
jgi:predicted RNA-binding Zn-ribbon protein involved in translation (DUF1610 family)